MTLEEIEAKSKKELRQMINADFEAARTAATDASRSVYIAEAEFLMRELDRRNDSWVSLRDLLLELVVIVLIGWEIDMSYWAEHLQEQNFKDEEAIFSNLQKSSDATVATLTTLRDTTVSMTKSIQEGVGLNYEPSLNFSYTPEHLGVGIANNGPTDVAIWGYVIDTFNVRFQEPVVVAGRNSGFVELKAFWEKSHQTIHDKGKKFKMTLFVRMKNGREYVAELTVYVAAYAADNFQIFVLDSHVKREAWGFRADGEKWR